jgi:hypothetical protein
MIWNLRGRQADRDAGAAADAAGDRMTCQRCGRAGGNWMWRRWWGGATYIGVLCDPCWERPDLQPPPLRSIA